MSETVEKSSEHETELDNLELMQSTAQLCSEVFFLKNESANIGKQPFMAKSHNLLTLKLKQLKEERDLLLSKIDELNKEEAALTDQLYSALDCCCKKRQLLQLIKSDENESEKLSKERRDIFIYKMRTKFFDNVMGLKVRCFTSGIVDCLEILFSRLSPRFPSVWCKIVMKELDDHYELMSTKPSLENANLLVEELNQSKDWIKFALHLRQAWDQIQLNGDTLEAVLVGCSVCQELQCDGTVGYGGSPNEFGETTLDALVIHGPTGDVGAVASLKRIKEAIRVAAAVMKYTKHTLLVGEAATSFALEMGFSESDLHTPESTQMWKTWVAGSCQPNYRKNVVPDPSKSCGPYTPLLQTDNTDDRSNAQIDSHDTIGMIAIHGEEISAGTSTNGMRYKIPGRVGDSPIPGSGAFVDNDVGAACATGDGDILMRMLPSYQAVENMRTSMTPTEAAMDAISRVAKKYPTFKGALIAANRYGHVGAACHGFDTFAYSLRDALHTGVVKIAIVCSKS
ncbi:putative N(4)-(beta-N-acetylglucosaminyl)-L-asparaginase [Trichinella pseudospiralis]|uniref:N(4)-(beta-N-acetylglucosaminyl)-L-asparaginase n=1 Tax=Trichinella pseudospiralis TaxID=6337 RepID=A0A0V1JB01_TRIPS|nr:putative N(4)-(beta-N-acetylglucosaminyl)-L-asparaginase [Trichinella pseudospiralis]